MIGTSALITKVLIALFGGAFLVALLPGQKDGSASKLQSMITSVVVLFALALTVQAGFDFDSADAARVQFAERHAWIPTFGVFYSVGADGLSLALWALTLFVSTLVIGWTITTTKARPAMLASLLFLSGSVLGCFVAQDLVLFFVFFELMLLPSYVLMIVFGGKGKERATLLFVLYTVLAGTFLLAGIVGLGALTVGSEPSFAYDDLASFAPRAPIWIFVVFTLGFAIKAALVPLHGWLVETYEKAPLAATIMFAALLSKVGLYGLFRISFGIFSDLAGQYGGVLFVLGTIGIVYGALVAWVQPNLKRLLAYSSLSHLGFCFIGLSSATTQGITGAGLQLINHGVTITALFLIVWALEQRNVDLTFDKSRGLASRMPWLAGYFLLFTLSSVAMPLTNNFVGEFLVLSGAVASSQSLVLSIVAGLGVIFVSIYMLHAVNKLLHGEILDGQDGGRMDLTWRERAFFVPLVVVIFVLGVTPQPLINVIEQSVVHNSGPVMPEIDARDLIESDALEIIPEGEV